MSNFVSLEAILLGIAVLFGIFSSSSQRGQQFYYTADSQQPRFIPSGSFQQQQQQQQQNYFQPPQFQDYSFSQGNPYSAAPPQSFQAFQQGAVRRPQFEDHFSQHFAPRPQSFLDQITLSPSGFSASVPPPPQPPRNPNSLRLVQGFPPGQSQFEPQFGGAVEQNRPPPATREFSTEVDDVGSFVDQNLEVEQGPGSPRPKINNRTSFNNARKEDAALRNKPGTRPQAGLRGNVLTTPQRPRQREEDITRVRPKTRSRLRQDNSTTTRPRNRLPSKPARASKVQFAPRRVSTTTTTTTSTSSPEAADEYEDEVSSVEPSEEEEETEHPNTEEDHSLTTDLTGNSSSTFEVLTMNPGHTLVEEDNFRGFVDSVLIDATESPTSSSVKPTTEEPAGSLYVSLHPNDTPEDGMVSVVTTKSVIDGSVFIVPDTSELPPAPEQAATPSATPPPSITTTTTEGWVIVASVQTSRSVSGARFLPSSAVKQEERPIPLSGKPSLHDKNVTDVKDMETNSTTEDKVQAAADLPSGTVAASTESILDKLDRVQSDLSIGILTGGGNKIQLEVLKDMADSTKMPPNISMPAPRTTTYKSPVNIRKFTPHSARSTTPKPKKTTISFDELPSDDLSGLLPPGFKNRAPFRRPKPSTERSTSNGQSDGKRNRPQNQKSPVYKPENSTRQESGKAKQTSSNETGKSSKHIEELLSKVKIDDVAAFLPPGYKPPSSTEKPATNHSKSIETLLSKVKVDDISALLPSGYKPPASTEKPSAPKAADALLKNAKPVDISAFLPPGYKSSATTEKPTNGSKNVDGLLKNAKPVDISAFLPPGYKSLESVEKTNASKGADSLLKNAKAVDISAFLPPGYKPSESIDNTTEAAVPSSTPESAPKVVFPSRPGVARKPSARTTTTHKPVEGPGVASPKIVKGWPTRATTAFTGWPTVSTTPISIEKLLEMAKTATTETSSSSTTTTTTTTTTSTTTTTTTPRPTTPGVCTSDCDLAATIKLVGGAAAWVPEFLDHNTPEWQDLANEVKTQLEGVYSKSEPLNTWYKKIRIDSFSEGSILVDYFVELTELGRQVDTQEIKRLFHNSLTLATPNDSVARSANLDPSDIPVSSRLKLGNFMLDPKYTDFIVLPKETAPTITYAEDDVLLPQWAIAGVVIGLASLLFVIIFGVTVLVNRSRNNKKKNPMPLTEDMLNELNKNHMGGFENMGADDLYNMEDVWNDKAYEKPPKKRSSASLQENSMSNLYDSWRSDWNGYYYNAYYGNGHPGSSASGYSRRRSDHDTNF